MSFHDQRGVAPTITGPLDKHRAKGNTVHNPSIPDGAQLDFGYTQWHSDGTELMNSGGHAANTGNFCVSATRVTVDQINP